MSAGGVVVALLLALGYVELVPEPSWGDWVVGLVAGSCVSRFLPEALLAGGAPTGFWRALWSALALAGLVAADVAAGTWRMARMMLGADLPCPGFVRLPMGARSARGAALHGLLVTLSPGSVLVDVDEEAEELLFHVAGVERDDFVRTAERMYARQADLLP